MGNEYLKSNVRVVLVDTCTVNLSTEKIEPIVTSGLGAAWIGNFKDNYFGNITSTSYFAFTRPKYNLPVSPIYDSISLLIKYNSSYYGDTTQLQKISVYRLNKNIELINNTYLYDTCSMPIADTSLILTQVFYPRPRSGKLINIKLPDALGENLFYQFKNNTSIGISDYDFSNYFKGLAFVPDANDKSICGFLVKDTSVCIRIYCHSALLNSNYQKVNYSISILADPSLQFNHITQDKTGTLFTNISPNKDPGISSALTGNMAFIQRITGLKVEITFPYLNDLTLLGKIVSVNNALLHIKPIRGSYVINTPLPDSLSFQIFGNLYPVNYGTGTMKLYKDNVNNDGLNTEYQVSLTSLMIDQVGGLFENKKHIMLSLPNADDPLRRVAIGDRNNLNNQIKLELLLTIYNNDTNQK